MDTSYNLSKICIKNLSKLKPNDKYEKLAECKNMYTKNINEKIKDELVGEKCKTYLQKQSKTGKITKQDLYDNCEQFKKIAEKKQKKGRGGRGRAQPKPQAVKPPEPPKKQPEITNKEIEKLKNALYKAIVNNDKNAVIKALGNIKEIVCIEALTETNKNLIQPLISGVIGGFKNPQNPYAGWSQNQSVLEADIYKPIEAIVKCGALYYGFGKMNSYFSNSGANLVRNGNPPPTSPPPSTPSPSNLEPQGQAQPMKREMTMPEYYQALLNQQTSKQYKQLATAQQKALEGDIAGSVERDKLTLANMGLVRTPQGIMSKENWEQFKKAGENLSGESSWGDLFSDLASNIPTALKAGVATAGGLLVPTMVVGRGGQAQTAEQARQANRDFANEPPFQQEGQAPKQPKKSSEELLGRARESIDRSKNLRAGLGLAGLGLLGARKPKTAAAIATATMMAPRETPEAISLDATPTLEEMDTDLATAIERSMLGGREEEAGKKPASLIPSRTPSEEQMRQLENRLERLRDPDLPKPKEKPLNPQAQTFERGEDLADSDLQALNEAFGDLQGQRFEFLTQRLKEQQPPKAEL